MRRPTPGSSCTILATRSPRTGAKSRSTRWCALRPAGGCGRGVWRTHRPDSVPAPALTLTPLYVTGRFTPSDLHHQGRAVDLTLRERDRQLLEPHLQPRHRPDLRRGEQRHALVRRRVQQQLRHHGEASRPAGSHLVTSPAPRPACRRSTRRTISTRSSSPTAAPAAAPLAITASPNPASTGADRELQPQSLLTGSDSPELQLRRRARPARSYASSCAISWACAISHAYSVAGDLHGVRERHDLGARRERIDERDGAAVDVHPAERRFHLQPDEPVGGQSIQFYDSTGGTPTSWSWTFGDGGGIFGGSGGTSTSQNPSYGYAAAGTYTVTLTASNACGGSQTTAVGPRSAARGAPLASAPTANFCVATDEPTRASRSVLRLLDGTATSVVVELRRRRHLRRRRRQLDEPEPVVLVLRPPAATR